MRDREAIARVRDRERLYTACPRLLPVRVGDWDSGWGKAVRASRCCTSIALPSHPLRHRCACGEVLGLGAESWLVAIPM